MSSIPKTAHSHETTPVNSANRGKSEARAQRPDLEAIQQGAGNLALQGFLQAKLSVSQPDDPYEKEADQVANQLVKKSSFQNGPPVISPLNFSQVQRLCSSCAATGPKACCEPERIQAKFDGSKGEAAAAHKSEAAPGGNRDYSFLQGGGNKLPERTRQQFEPRLGRSLEHVRVHTGSTAAEATREVHAKAFTVNNHIAFAPGQFAPHTDSGQWLLAHELTHVLQQSGHNMMVQRLNDGPATDDWVSRRGSEVYESTARARRRHDSWSESHRDSFHAALDGQNGTLAEDIAGSRATVTRHRLAMLDEVMGNQAAEVPDTTGFGGMFQRQPHLPADLMPSWARAELAKDTLLTAMEGEEITDETAEAVRSAFSVFFQALLQASQAQESYEAALRRDYQAVQDDLAAAGSASAVCHGGCHAAPSRAGPSRAGSSHTGSSAPAFDYGAFPGLPSSAGGNTATAGSVDNNALFDANPAGWVDSHTDSIVIKVRVASHLLAGAVTLPQWERVLTEYGVATGVLDNLLLQRLPRTSELVQAFEFARDLLARQEAFQRDAPDAIKIPAVFYPNEQFSTVTNAAGESQSVANGIPWMFYLTQVENPAADRWAEDFEWELHDMTSAGRPSVRFRPNDVLKAVSTPATFVDPPVALFEQLNHRLKFPEGYLYWTAPSGQGWSMPTTEPWTLSDWLSAIGVSLTVLGIVLGTAGYGTPAAIAVAASAGLGISSTLVGLDELEAHNRLTQGDIDRAALSIAVDVLSVITLGLGRVVTVSMQSATRAAAAGASGTAARALSVATRANRLWFVSQAAATGAEGIKLYVAGQDFVQQVRLIQSQPGLTDQQRNDAVGRLVLTAMLTGGLMLFSLGNGMRDLRRGSPVHLDIDSATGAATLRPALPEAGAASGAADEVADAAGDVAHRGLRPGARGSVELEGEATVRNAAGETHEFGLWHDGRLTRCSDFCTELTENVLDRLRRLRGDVPHNSSHIEALREVAAEARTLRREAAEAAADPATLAGRRDQLLERARGLEMRTSLIEEQIGRELGAFHSTAPRGWPVRQVDYDTLPRDLGGNINALPPGVVYEFPGGHRAWRMVGGGIAHESYAGPAHGRQGFEHEFYLPGEAGRSGHHRAHSLGQGTGFESPFAIPYAPAEVNLAIQNDGIEEMLRGLRDESPAGAHFHVRTETHMHPGSMDLRSITYRIEVSQAGRRAELFEFDIEVGGTPGNRTITYGVPSATTDPALQGLLEMVDVPERVRARTARIRARWGTPRTGSSGSGGSSGGSSGTP